MREKIKFFAEKITRFSWQRVGFILLTVAVVGVLFTGALAAYGYTFRERTLPGIKLGQFDVGEMRTAELKMFLERMSDKMVDEGWNFVYAKDGGTQTLRISPLMVSDGSSFELARWDTDEEAERLLFLGKSGSVVSTGWRAFLGSIRWRKTELKVENFSLDKIKLRQILQSRLSEGEEPPRDANVKITSLSPLNFIVTKPQAGDVIDYDHILQAAQDNWATLQNKDIAVEKNKRQPVILEKEAAGMANKLPKIFAAGDLLLAYKDPETKREYSWQLTAEQLSKWLQVKKDNNGGLFFGLDFEQAGKFLADKAAPQINVAPRDAKFKMGEDGKVIEFQGSRPGMELQIYGSAADEPGTVNLLEAAFKERSIHDSGFTKVVTAVVSRVEPNVKTSDVNDLGIKEALGVGVSSYAGSPRNRILNIKNAVKKLNGILLKPGEEFSALKFLRPFTEEGGYLPELVIKGDEIKPEIGGGLCQIGTTLFRMAMNAGMKITERRNHSLVVNYYNDPANGNPGTDATIYDPSPDFRFVNDTGNYILIQTEMDTVNQKLYFTIWGANDGRKGYYSAPQVGRWIRPGEKKIIETTKLEPGKTQCQHVYIGADASFTYTRELADGTKEETVYESHYRPLPEICLVGVAETPPEPSPESSTDAPPAMDDNNPVVEG